MSPVRFRLVFCLCTIAALEAKTDDNSTLTLVETEKDAPAKDDSLYLGDSEDTDRYYSSSSSSSSSFSSSTGLPEFDVQNSSTISDDNSRSDDNSSSDVDANSDNCTEKHGHGNSRLLDILETQKLDILMRLGFKHLPHASKENLSDHELRRILWHFRQSEEAIRDETSNTILFRDDHPLAVQFYSYTDNGYRPLEFETRRGHKSVYFEINIYKPHEEGRQTVVNAATLKLYKSYVKPELIISSDFVDKSVSVSIRQVINDTSGLVRKTVAARHVSLENIGWEEFDVTRAVQDWLSEPESNFGFEVACDSCSDMEDLIRFVTWNDSTDGASRSGLNGDAESADDDEKEERGESKKFWPILNVITRSVELPDAGVERTRRSLAKRQAMDLVDEESTGVEDDCEKEEERRRGNCCSEASYNVTFADWGWNWVIHPRSISLQACTGSCGRGSLCISSEREPVALVHFDERLNVLLSLLPDVVPRGCHCTDR